MKLKIRQNVRHCTQNYFMNMKRTCIKYDFILTMNENKFQAMSVVKNQKNFSCNNGQTLKISWKDDLIPDCGPGSEDEPILLALKTKIQTYDCQPFGIPIVNVSTSQIFVCTN